MIAVIKRYKKLSFIKSFKSIPHKDYLGLMKICALIIGNSSSAIIEAPSFNVPVINIGTRQQGRQQGKNVINVTYKKEEIVEAIKRVLYDREFKEQLKGCINPYGDGHASKRIVNILTNIKLDKKLLQKRISY